MGREIKLSEPEANTLKGKKSLKAEEFKISTHQHAFKHPKVGKVMRGLLHMRKGRLYTRYTVTQSASSIWIS